MLATSSKTATSTQEEALPLRKNKLNELTEVSNQLVCPSPGARGEPLPVPETESMAGAKAFGFAADARGGRARRQPSHDAGMRCGELSHCHPTGQADWRVEFWEMRLPISGSF